ncbi:MAG: MBL fold metallo-hydrolase [Candidatus Nomurabacteria bacterium]|nr:MBL fold metallo-hydrolase [Candidatus Nomurabacteria bacterium]
MKIKKLGHCCLIIEIDGKRIMTDPGSYTIEKHNQEKSIDIILITHEHGDHYHLESLKEILVNNPEATIVTNQGVGQLLDEAGIKYQILENKIETEILGIELEAHDCRHEEIYEEIGQVQNTGFFIGKKLFYPGDAFYNPQKVVEILALPVAGPWTRVKDAIKYALEIKPKICFPVHDGMIDPSFGTAHRVPGIILPNFGIEFKSFEENKEEEF